MSIDSIYKDHINPELLKIGFKKRVSGIYTVDIAAGVIGWLGLNQATQHHAAGEFHINPVVGVRHQELERIAAECTGRKFHSYSPATINRPLGYVTPENTYKTWDFTLSNAAEAARDMAAAIAAHGLTFMRGNAALPGMYDKLEKGFHAMKETIAINKPIALLLMDDPVRAGQVLDEELAKLGPRVDPAAEYYRKFAGNFRKILPPG